MPHSCKIPSDLSFADAPKPRSCHLRKSHPQQDYGFDLHADRKLGQFIGNVDTNSPAELAGLCTGDRIIAVNGMPVTPQQHHMAVVNRIKENPLECRFVVIDEAGFLWYTSRKMKVPLNVNDAVESPVPPSLPPPIGSHPAADAQPKIEVDDVCGSVLEKNDNVVGDVSYNVNCAIEQNGATYADASCELVAGVGGVGALSAPNITVAESHQADDSVTLSATEQPRTCRTLHYEEGQGDGLSGTLTTHETPVSKELNGQRSSLPYSEMAGNEEMQKQPNMCLTTGERPRLCKLQKSCLEEEYGFNLHAEKNKGHFIGKVDDGSPAQRAGLLQSWRIVGVNGTLIYQKTPHKEVVALIKSDPLKTDLLIVSPELDAQYAEKRLEFSFTAAEVFSSSNQTHTTVNQINGTASTVTNETVISRKEQQGPETPVEVKITESSEHKKENGATAMDKSFEKLSMEPGDCMQNKNGTCVPSSNGDIKGYRDEEPVDIFHLSASQMRERVLRHKKVDLRDRSISLEKKYDIIQNL